MSDGWSLARGPAAIGRQIAYVLRSVTVSVADLAAVQHCMECTLHLKMLNFPIPTALGKHQILHAIRGCAKGDCSSSQSLQ